MATCDACDKVSNRKATGYWYLNNYHGLTGMVCDKCFDKAKHYVGDPREQATPVSPRGFAHVKRKLAEKMADKMVQP